MSMTIANVKERQARLVSVAKSTLKMVEHAKLTEKGQKISAEIKADMEKKSNIKK